MGKPYFGMTGTALNAWVNVAAITAMNSLGSSIQGTFNKASSEMNAGIEGDGAAGGGGDATE